MRLRRKPRKSKTSDYFEGTIGELMEAPLAVFVPEQTVGEAIESIRELVKTQFITYAWVLEADGKLVGVVTMRDLLFNDRATKLGDNALDVCRNGNDHSPVATLQGRRQKVSHRLT